MAETKEQLEALTEAQLRAILTRSAVAVARRTATPDTAEAIAFAERKLQWSPSDRQRLGTKLRGLATMAGTAGERQQLEQAYATADQRVRELDPLNEAVRLQKQAKQALGEAIAAERNLAHDLSELERLEGLDREELRDFADQLKVDAAGREAPSR